MRKYIRLYCDEIVSVVPRTGHMGPDPSCPGLDLPRRSVMDQIEAALAGVRLYRGKAAGGMAVFDAGLVIGGKETERQQATRLRRISALKARHESICNAVLV